MVGDVSIPDLIKLLMVQEYSKLISIIKFKGFIH